MDIFILTSSFYGERGYSDPYRTLEGAQAAAPGVVQWEREVTEDRGEFWTGSETHGNEWEIQRSPLGP